MDVAFKEVEAVAKSRMRMFEELIDKSIQLGETTVAQEYTLQRDCIKNLLELYVAGQKQTLDAKDLCRNLQGRDETVKNTLLNLCKV